MTGHLLAVEIGPVQEFITSARRTRDHWFGSYLVAEIAKAAAKGIADAMPPDGWKNLIFPAPEGPAELEPESRLAVADVLLAEIPPGASPEEVARAAERAVDRRWRSYANTALEQAGPFVRMDVWESQVAEVMECYTAWVPRTNSYPADRRRVMKVLAGRTTCRNFPPAEKEWWGVPKSSLDGMRESVLREPSDPQEKEKRARRLRLNRGEQLDVVALTKRLGGGRMQYPSVSRLVADPWLRGVARTPAAAGDYRRLKDLCRNLVREDILTGINANVYRQYADFPFEAAALFPERYPELAEEAGVPLEHLRGLGHIVGQLTKNREYRLGEPDRYYAILTADGDRLTKALDQIETPVEHRRFSHQLDQFAERARQLITSPDPGAQGALVYAGGDDVLAFVPVDKVLPCARRLREEFVTLLREWSKPDRPLSLSVGIGVGHFL
ncbi:MAG: type III-B CRISPR-associated protein Cas10/Cmr2, partial [Planctomycetes bacterium]|nr:type III-B CRISPR-associated protein Cas10/Cmr2 [Planctomycetota bacterium]